ncbi:SGNH/GDSL hydrolase family protein [Mycoplasma miroungirhinis]|uniref:SGNH/GDSL hydrolase family protein n=1 Tax=Mycoplasma miroungirhinis TaxID=754516 RepID=A0A6M4JAI4_9MOLU|nr:SGNH/GDSL hydrolase family protein [Mycoplasma miroungirhinis]QJR44004.1 SGNH/GDSL hydrolase family protein [Mycoplasma miroungirhinis]
MNLDNELEDKNEVKFNFLPIKENLNYLSIGDEFSGGFNSKFGFLSLGKFYKHENKVTGLSYPAFFARIIHNLNAKYLKDFDNFSFPNIKIKQYIELIEHNNLSDETKNILHFANVFNNEEANPFIEQYDNYWNDIKNIQTKVKQANLITINLGMHDWINFFPLQDVKNLYSQQTKENIQHILEQLHSSLKLRATKITKYIENLINVIKSYNPRTNIVVMGYSKPLIHFENVLNETLLKTKIKDVSIINMFMFYLNSALKTAANKSCCMYIDNNDLDFATKHKDFLYESYFDIHPSEKMYKFIAQNMVIKLGLDNKFVFESYKNNNQKVLSYLRTINEYKKDYLSHRKILNLGEDLSILVRVLGINRSDNLFLDDYYEDEKKDILKQQNQISWYVSHLEKDLNLNIKQLIIQFIKSKFYSQNEIYKTKDLLLNYLQEKKWAQQIILHILSGNAVNNFFIALQNNLNSYRKFNASFYISDLKNAKNNTIKNQKLIYAIVKNLLSASFIHESKNELKQINYTFLTEILNTNLLETLVNHKLDERYKYIRNYLSKQDIFREFADFLFMNLTINLKNYSELNTFDQAWEKWLILNHYKIIYYIDKIISEVSRKENKKQTIEFIKLSILLAHKIPENNNLDTKKLELKIDNIIWLANEHKEILNKYLKILLKEFQTFSIYDYIFSNTKGETKKEFTLKLFKKIRYINVLRKFIIAILSLQIEIKSLKKQQKLQSENK